MSWANAYIGALRQGKEVSFRPTGGSMAPFIQSGQLVTCTPANQSSLRKGDIVLCTVGRNQYLHFIHAVYPGKDGESPHYQISNAKDRIFGWARADQVYGKVISIQD